MINIQTIKDDIEMIKRLSWLVAVGVVVSVFIDITLVFIIIL